MDYVEGEIGFLLFNDSFIHEHNSFISTLSLAINIANFQNQKTWILIFFSFNRYLNIDGRLDFERF